MGLEMYIYSIIKRIVLKYMKVTIPTDLTVGPEVEVGAGTMSLPCTAAAMVALVDTRASING